MKSMRWMFRALGGTALLILGGCWTPAPYGYSSYPAYPAPPNQGFVAPPGAVVVPGNYPPPQMGPPAGPGGTWTPPTPPTPASPSFGPPGQLPPMQGAPQGLNGGPTTFSEPRMGETRRPENNLVPDPIDAGPPRVSPGPAAGPVGPAPTEQNASPFGSDGDKSFDSKGTQIEIPKRDGSGPESMTSNRAEGLENTADRDGKLDSGVVAVAAKTVDAATRAALPNRYDYDRVSYSYLRGVVEFNPRDHAWHIVYNPKPDAGDKFGGAFQLVDNPRLKALGNGDVVFIQGRVNPRQTDSRGKPKYEIGDEVARITHRGTQPVGN